MMPVMNRLPALLLSLVCLAPTARAADAPGLPTEKDIEQAYAAKQDTPALQMLARVLPLKGPATKGYNRHKLLEIKGEILLRQKVQSDAAIAFDDASDETKDSKVAAIDDATSLLIKRSPNQAYTPKAKSTKGGVDASKPIDIVDAASRKLALKALFTDELAANEPKVRAAVSGSALPPVLDAVPFAKDLRALEIAADGDDNRTKKLTDDLSSHARTLLESAVKNMESKARSIQDKANDPVEFKQQKPGNGKEKDKKPQMETKWRLRGLGNGEQGTLQDIVATSNRIDPACTQLSKAFPALKGEWQSIRSKADDARKAAHAALSANYSKVFDRKP